LSRPPDRFSETRAHDFPSRTAKQIMTTLFLGKHGTLITTQRSIIIIILSAQTPELSFKRIRHRLSNCAVWQHFEICHSAVVYFLGNRPSSVSSADRYHRSIFSAGKTH